MGKGGGGEGRGWGREGVGKGGGGGREAVGPVGTVGEGEERQWGQGGRVDRGQGWGIPSTKAGEGICGEGRGGGGEVVMRASEGICGKGRREWVGGGHQSNYAGLGMGEGGGQGSRGARVVGGGACPQPKQVRALVGGKVEGGGEEAMGPSGGRAGEEGGRRKGWVVAW